VSYIGDGIADAVGRQIIKIAVWLALLLAAAFAAGYFVK